MYSVTARIAMVKQPRGGYLKPSLLHVCELKDEKTLREEENVHATIVGLTVDYLTRYMMGVDKKEAFRISCYGAMIANIIGGRPWAQKEAENYLSAINGIDDASIISACKLATFDVWKRNVAVAALAKDADNTRPDENTIRNIQIMVIRSLKFWNEYGPIVKDGFTFEQNGYSKMVSSGDGDYLTSDTLWDFKVSKAKPNSKHTLQLLMYWIMGQHSGKKEFKKIDKIGIFNPRLNTVYTYEMKDIPPETIREIENDVICYE